MSNFMEQHFGTGASMKQALLDSMKEHGVAYLEAHYSGGNDEGGVDELKTLKDAEGNDVTIENLSWEHPLQQAADNLLSTEFVSWAGDFSAYGVLTADAKTGKVSRAGEISGYTSDSAEY